MDAAAAARPEAICQLKLGEDETIHGWITNYEITTLRGTVTNEQTLLSLDVIDSAQLSNSMHRLEQALDLQSAQQFTGLSCPSHHELLYERLGHAVATSAIARGMRMEFA